MYYSNVTNKHYFMLKAYPHSIKNREKIYQNSITDVTL